MNLAHQFKQLFIILSISLLGTTQVMASSIRLDIEGDACVFSAACGGDGSHTVYASGSFKLWDFFGVADPNTIANLPEARYRASTTVDFGIPSHPDTNSQTFETKEALLTDPNWQPALAIFQAVAGLGAGGGGTLPPLGGVTIDFTVADLVQSQSPSGQHVEGTFTASTNSDLDAVNNLAKIIFNNDAINLEQGDEFQNFSASAQLAVIPEPISLALLGLGMVAMASTRRKHA